MIEAIKQALEALEDLRVRHVKQSMAITALRQAIAEASKQEPVAVVIGTHAGRFVVNPLNPAMVLPVNMALYTTPQPKREWVGLTDEERSSIRGDYLGYDAQAKAIEQTLKEKNT